MQLAIISNQHKTTVKCGEVVWWEKADRSNIMDFLDYTVYEMYTFALCLWNYVLEKLTESHLADSNFFFLLKYLQKYQQNFPKIFCSCPEYLLQLIESTKRECKEVFHKWWLIEVINSPQLFSGRLLIKFKWIGENAFSDTALCNWKYWQQKVLSMFGKNEFVISNYQNFMP